jgi:hypothetical protein
MSESKRARMSETSEMDDNYQLIESQQERSDLLCIQLDVMKHGVFTLNRGRFTTVAGLKDELRKQLEDAIPDLENNRLLVLCKQTRFDDSTTLDHIISQEEMTDASSVDMVAIVLERPEVKNEAHTVLHTTRVLNNNVRECMDSTIKGNVNARDRPRHNEAEFTTPEIPTMYDFGLVTEELAHSFALAGQAHKKLATCLREIEADHELNETGAQTMLDQSRMTIQNTLDGNRYMCPMLKNYSRIVPKLGDDCLLKDLDVMPLG